MDKFLPESKKLLKKLPISAVIVLYPEFLAFKVQYTMHTRYLLVMLDLESSLRLDISPYFHLFEALFESIVAYFDSRVYFCVNELAIDPLF
jgi:hypothetical protein